MKEFLTFVENNLLNVAASVTLFFFVCVFAYILYLKEKNHQYRENLKVETDCAIKRKKAGPSEHPVDKKSDRPMLPGRQRSLSRFVLPLIITIIGGLTVEFVWALISAHSLI